MGVKETLVEILKKDLKGHMEFEVSKTDTFKYFHDHWDFLCKGKSIFRAWNNDSAFNGKVVFVTNDLLDKSVRSKLNDCFYAVRINQHVFVRNGKVYFGTGKVSKSIELDMNAIYEWNDSIHGYASRLIKH